MHKGDGAHVWMVHKRHAAYGEMVLMGHGAQGEGMGHRDGFCTERDLACGGMVCIGRMVCMVGILEGGYGTTVAWECVAPGCMLHGGLGYNIFFEILLP